MQLSSSSVYGLVDPRHRGVQLIFYIGVSEEPYARYGEHLLIRSNDKTGPKGAYILDMRKDGVIPGLIIIEKDLPTNDAEKRETYWIGHFLALGMPLTNIQKTASLRAGGSSVSAMLKVGIGVNTWGSSTETVEALSEFNGRAIHHKYLHILWKNGKLDRRPIDGRTFEYNLEQARVLTIIEKKGAGRRKAEVSLETDENL